MDLKTRMKCPCCDGIFVAEEGFCFRVPYTQQEERKIGILAFCSMTCILQCVSDEQCGHA